jgi:hypothetical protein
MLWAVRGDRKMVRHSEASPMDDPVAAGTYKQLNIFGSPTGIRINLRQGEPLPLVPAGHSWMFVGDDDDKC